MLVKGEDIPKVPTLPFFERIKAVTYLYGQKQSRNLFVYVGDVNHIIKRTEFDIE